MAKREFSLNLQNGKNAHPAGCVAKKGIQLALVLFACGSGTKWLSKKIGVLQILLLLLGILLAREFTKREKCLKGNLKAKTEKKPKREFKS